MNHESSSDDEAVFEKTTFSNEEESSDDEPSETMEERRERFVAEGLSPDIVEICFVQAPDLLELKPYTSSYPKPTAAERIAEKKAWLDNADEFILQIFRKTGYNDWAWIDKRVVIPRDCDHLLVSTSISNVSKPYSHEFVAEITFKSDEGKRLKSVELRPGQISYMNLNRRRCSRIVRRGGVGYFAIPVPKDAESLIFKMGAGYYKVEPVQLPSELFAPEGNFIEPTQEEDFDKWYANFYS
jgi:hypothetical protein